mgnify:CR=1 FL=1
MKKIIFFTLSLIIVTPIFANDYKLGDRVVLEINKPVNISNITLTYRGKGTEVSEGCRKSCGNIPLLFDISVNGEKFLHEHFHSCDISPSTFTINNTEYALEVGDTQALPYPRKKGLSENEIILWEYGEWHKQVGIALKTFGALKNE